MCSFFDDPVVNRNKQSLAHRQKEKKLDAYMSENVFFLSILHTNTISF